MVLKIGGRLCEWKRAAVMGIMNMTVDSFHAASRVPRAHVLDRATRMLEEGCDILDLGACSTSPGVEQVRESEELSRVVEAVKAIRKRFGDRVVISVDTYRSAVASAAVECGADIINDVSGGSLDEAMFETVARLGVPYIVSHMRGTPLTMQSLTQYDDVVSEVLCDLAFKIDRLHQLGVSDIIVDPGFGFAKTLDQNYQIMAQLEVFGQLGCPVLAAISRKSMITGELHVSPAEALNGTTALDMAALMKGASILRVHDVKEAVETVSIFEALKRNTPRDLRTIKVSDKSE